MTVPQAAGQVVDTTLTRRIVTCTLGDEIYGVPVEHVREVLRWMPFTRIPHGAASMRGVINLRGEIIPLIDLRVHLDLPATEPNDRTCIIVVSVQRGSSRLKAGLIVDSALEVIRIGTAEVESGQEALPGRSGRFVSGITPAKNGLILLLACEALMHDALVPAAVEANG